MWYRYFVKDSWNLRVWRKANLKFNQDDFGMLRHKYILRWKDFLFRAVRTEGAMRGFNFFFGAGAISIILHLKGTYYDPTFTAPKKLEAQKMLEEKDAEAKAKLFFNKFGGPTRPQRSLEDLITFMAGSWTYDQLADFVSYNAGKQIGSLLKKILGMDVNMDMQKGLDSWMSTEDQKMLKYYQKTIGRKVDV